MDIFSELNYIRPSKNAWKENGGWGGGEKRTLLIMQYRHDKPKQARASLSVSWTIASAFFTFASLHSWTWGSSLDQPLLCVSISFYCLFDRIIIAVHRIVVLIIVIILPVANWDVFAVAIVALIVLHPYNSLFVFPLISNFSSSFHLRFLSLGLGCIERSRPTSSQYR